MFTGQRVRSLVAAFVLTAASDGLVVPVFGTTPLAEPPTPAPTNTEGGFPEIRCGDGRIEPGEGCDDGNLFGGDGCDLSCTPETFFTQSFVPVLENVFLPASDTIELRGTITFAQGQSGIVTVRRFDLEEPQLVFGGYVCTVAVPLPDLGPGNVGQGGFSGPNSSMGILDVTINIQRWSGGADRGLDGLPCTADDPGFPTASIALRQFHLILPSVAGSHCCGDCDGNGSVTIDELLSAVNNALDSCPVH